MDSNWAKYMKEEYGRETIEVPSGFITYKVHGEECMIYDLYVKKEVRGINIGISMCNLVFKEAVKAGCNSVTCLVDTSNPKGTGLCETYIRHGFKIIGASNNQIVMAKEI